MNIEVILRELLPKVCFGGVKLQRKNRLASNGRRFATRPLFWQDRRTPGNARNFFYTHDGNKNVSEVVSYSAANGLAAHYECVPFSAVTLQSGAFSFATSFRFSSEYADDDTATVYYNYRHCEPVMGRWLGRDPIGENDDSNIYAFCVNSVSKYVDLMGLRKDSRCCCKLCLYSATPKKTFDDNNPIVVGATTVFGHTWATKEKCNSPEDQIVLSDLVYSFGPVERVAFHFRRFTEGKLLGGSYKTGDYTPDKFVVVKKCWKLGQDQCDKLVKDIKDKNKYPKYFTPEVYCTTTAIRFAREHGASDIPDSYGPVVYDGKTQVKPNPKTLAENMSKNGGIVVKVPKKGKKK